MSTPANLLVERTFDGVGYPTFSTVWPGFTFPSAGAINPNGWSQPVVDGNHHGIPSRTISGVTWRAKCTSSPGRTDYQDETWAKWANAGFSGDRWAELIARMRDAENCIVARITSKGTSSPELDLVKIANGVETVLGSYTGAGLSATAMNAGLRWRMRVEDLESGDTRVTVYLAPTGADDKGTQVVDWTGDVGNLRGYFTGGVGIGGVAGGTDVRVGDFRIYDLADEWNPSGSTPAPGSGWTAELGNVLYSMADLEALTPKVTLMSVRQGYGVRGNVARFRVDGDYRVGSVLKPGVPVRVFHDGDTRFRGWIESGSLSATPGEGQTWEAFDSYFAARQVRMEEDDCTGTHHFNVSDETADEYRSDRQGMTTGDILAWLFDRYTDRAEGLKFYGAAPSDGTAYVTSELAALDAEIPDVSVAGTFPAVVESLLTTMGYRFQVWIDPGDLVWHFRDVTALATETIECTASHVLLRMRPSRTEAYTAVEWRGARPEDAPTLELSVSGGDLLPVWTDEMQTKYGKNKRAKSIVTLSILSSGTGTAPDGIVRMYADVTAGLLDENDIRMWALSVQGHGHAWLCAANTSTRVWFSPPTLGGAPPLTPGLRITANALGENALAALSAQGVGRGYHLARPATICGTWIGGAQGVKNAGWCGEAVAETTGIDGTKSTERFAYNLRRPNAAQYAAGHCSPVVELSEKPLPSIGLVNYLPPKGSVPKGTCVPGDPKNTAPAVDVRIKIPTLEDCAPYFRVPADAETFQGDAFDDWNAQQVYTVNDPDFIDASQIPGLTKAANHILAVKSQKPWLFDVEIATPWSTTTPETPTIAPTSTWAGLGKRVAVSSSLRTTGFEAGTEELPVLSVTWDVEGNRTVLESGTVAAWLEVSGVDIGKAFSEARAVKKALAEVKRLEDFRRKLLEKNAAMIGGQRAGNVEGCAVEVSNDQVKRVVNVQKDDEDKIANITHGAMTDFLGHSLAVGVDTVQPGAPLEIPGHTHRVAVDGPVLQSPLELRWGAFQGPALGHEGLGRYGGNLTDGSGDDGQPSRTVMRAGGLIFRKREDASGNTTGGPGLEYQQADADGNPVGGPWSIYNRPSDLPNARAPYSLLSAGSLNSRMLERSRTLAKRLLMVEDSLDDIAEVVNGAAGTTVKADLPTIAQAGVLGATFKLEPGSWSDPGGPVWRGPYREGGADSEQLWRVHPVLAVPALVTDAGAGAGDYGGRYSFDQPAGANTVTFLASAMIVSKQIHLGSDFETDNTQPSLGSMPGAAEPGHPFATTAHLRTFNSAMASGWAWTVDVPPGVTGKPMFWATVAEDPGFAGIYPAGMTHVFQIDHAYKASPWSAPTAGTPTAAVTTDGAGTGEGQFKQPGGSVPPGLRRVSGSIIHTPGAGTAPPGSTPVITGAGFEVAVTETGWALIVHEKLGAVDVPTVSHVGPVDRMGTIEAWSFEAGKELADGQAMGESWQLDLNPPADVFESQGIGEAWAIELNGVPVYP